MTPRLEKSKDQVDKLLKEKEEMEKKMAELLEAERKRKDEEGKAANLQDHRVVRLQTFKITRWLVELYRLVKTTTR